MAGRAAVLYHYPCPDGAFAALAAYLYHSRLEVPAVFFPNTVYNPIKIKDLDQESFDVFYLLDFVGPEGFALELCSKAKKVIVLDHHKTAYEALAAKSFSNLVTNFDMRRSGATIAFDYFTNELQRGLRTRTSRNPPSLAGKDLSRVLSLVDTSSLTRIRRLFDYIEDADLWNWKLPQSKAFHSGLKSLNIEYNANTNANLFQQLLSLEASEVIAIGEKELLSNQIRLEAAVQRSFVVDLGQGLFGKCLAVESNELTDLRSELGHQLAARSLTLGLRPIGAVAYKVEDVDPELVKVSLRSIEGEDTTKVSQAYGGGGHASASSFMISQRTFDSWKLFGHQGLLNMAGTRTGTP